jgi:hypothetical protein
MPAPAGGGGRSVPEGREERALHNLAYRIVFVIEPILQFINSITGFPDVCGHYDGAFFQGNRGGVIRVVAT